MKCQIGFKRSALNILKRLLNDSILTTPMTSFVLVIFYAQAKAAVFEAFLLPGGVWAWSDFALVPTSPPRFRQSRRFLTEETK